MTQAGPQQGRSQQDLRSTPLPDKSQIMQRVLELHRTGNLEKLGLSEGNVKALFEQFTGKLEQLQAITQEMDRGIAGDRISESRRLAIFHEITRRIIPTLSRADNILAGQTALTIGGLAWRDLKKGEPTPELQEYNLGLRAVREINDHLLSLTKWLDAACDLDSPNGLKSKFLAYSIASKQQSLGRFEGAIWRNAIKDLEGEIQSERLPAGVTPAQQNRLLQHLERFGKSGRYFEKSAFAKLIPRSASDEVKQYYSQWIDTIGERMGDARALLEDQVSLETEHLHKVIKDNVFIDQELQRARFEEMGKKLADDETAAERKAELDKAESESKEEKKSEDKEPDEILCTGRSRSDLSRNFDAFPRTEVATEEERRSQVLHELGGVKRGWFGLGRPKLRDYEGRRLETREAVVVGKNNDIVLGFRRHRNNETGHDALFCSVQRVGGGGFIELQVGNGRLTKEGEARLRKDIIRLIEECTARNNRKNQVFTHGGSGKNTVLNFNSEIFQGIKNKHGQLMQRGLFDLAQGTISKLYNCQLKGANVSRVRVINGEIINVRFEKCQMIGFGIWGTRAYNVNMRGCSAFGFDFEKSWLKNDKELAQKGPFYNRGLLGWIKDRIILVDNFPFVLIFPVRAGWKSNLSGNHFNMADFLDCHLGDTPLHSVLVGARFTDGTTMCESASLDRAKDREQNKWWRRFGLDRLIMNFGKNGIHWQYGYMRMSDMKGKVGQEHLAYLSRLYTLKKVAIMDADAGRFIKRRDPPGSVPDFLLRDPEVRELFQTNHNGKLAFNSPVRLGDGGTTKDIDSTIECPGMIGATPIERTGKHHFSHQAATPELDDIKNLENLDFTKLRRSYPGRAVMCERWTIDADNKPKLVALLALFTEGGRYGVLVPLKATLLPYEMEYTDEFGRKCKKLIFRRRWEKDQESTISDDKPEVRWPAERIEYRMLHWMRAGGPKGTMWYMSPEQSWLDYIMTKTGAPRENLAPRREVKRSAPKEDRQRSQEDDKEQQQQPQQKQQTRDFNLDQEIFQSRQLTGAGV